MEKLEKGLKELKRIATHRKNNNNSQQDTLPNSSQQINYQKRSAHGGTHSYSIISSRGWSYLASIGQEALGPMKA